MKTENPAPTESKETGTAPKYSDYTNASALIQNHGDKLRFCYTNKRWYVWNQNVWEMQPKNGGIARQYAIANALAVKIETDHEGKQNKTQANWKKYSLSNSGISNTLSLAETDPRIAVKLTDFDNHPYEINTPEGIINLKTGELNPPNPERMHTQITSTGPGQNTPEGKWAKFLDDTLDPTIHDFMQRLIGAAAIGANVTPYFPFFYGTGANGKSVFLESLKHVFGDYATSIDSTPLMRRSNKDAERFYVELLKKRFVISSELNEDDEFNEARIKALTGGDTLTARALYSESIDFTPTHMIFAAGNHKPEVPSGGGHSFWRRFLIVDFDRTIAPDDINPDLQRELTTDGAQEIMNWIVEGAVKFIQKGIDIPDKIKDATKVYEEEADPLGVFIKEQCSTEDSQSQTSFSDLFSTYTRWCTHVAKVTPVSPHKFTPRLRAMGYETYRTGKERGFMGIKIRLSEAKTVFEAS